MLVIAILIVAIAVWWTGQQVVAELRTARDAAAQARSLAVLRWLTSGVAAAEADPRALLVWHPLAKTARRLLAKEFAALDLASGATFPFTPEQVQSAHAQWTADWLAWERRHDADYKLKAATIEAELAASGGSTIIRGRLEAVEREKLDLYQRRYQEYVRVAKALQALI